MKKSKIYKLCGWCCRRHKYLKFNEELGLLLCKSCEKAYTTELEKTAQKGQSKMIILDENFTMFNFYHIIFLLVVPLIATYILLNFNFKKFLKN